MNPTKIEYLTHTWNPLAMRCSIVSEGCHNCWHLRMCDRLAANPAISQEERVAYSDGGMPPVMTTRINEPLKLKKPARIGVQFMGDLFHPRIILPTILRIFDRMQQAPQHVFLVLTKRPERMLEFCKHYGIGDTEEWPVNVWAGVTVEKQGWSGKRIPALLQIPAAKRFVSIEPILGPVDMSPYLPSLDWVIVGGETGPHARPANAEWFNNLINQCKAARVPIFVKKAPDGVDIIREYPA